MSRVRKPGKFMNTAKYDDSVTRTSKMIRIHTENEDYHKTTTLSHWLFVKYDMTYKQFRNKSKNRRKALREEFFADTGVNPETKTKVTHESHADDEHEAEDAMQLLASIGVPFDPFGNPIGIG